MARRHEIDELDRTPSGLELGREDQRAVQITPLGLGRGRTGSISQRPCSGLPRSAAKHAAEFETRQAKPVYRAASGDQSGRAAIADHRVVLDPQIRHSQVPVRLLRRQRLYRDNGASPIVAKGRQVARRAHNRVTGTRGATRPVSRT